MSTGGVAGATIAGMPFRRLEIDRHGSRCGGSGDLVPAGTTDLIVLSHGWKNDADDATALYAGMLERLVAAAGGEFGRNDRRFAAIGVYWPALRYQPDLSLVEDGPADDGRGGSAAAGASDLTRAELAAEARRVGTGLFDDPDAFAAFAVAAAGGGGAADDFVEHLRGLLSVADEPTVAEHRHLLKGRGGELLEGLAHGGPLLADADGSGSVEGLGAAAGRSSRPAAIWNFRSGGRAAVASILNQATYYEMKARAGVVGTAVAAVVDAVAPRGVRLHLVGHSFGARVVTAATAVTATPVRSLSLLQAAFSHNAFGTSIGRGRIDGWFRHIVADGIVAGPVLVTHTRKDRAVGFFYAVASVVSGEIAKGRVLDRLVGGPADPHGGLGANGAQSMLEGETVELSAEAGAIPSLVAGKVNNVKCDAVIGGHNDVVNAAVGELLWRAVAT